MNADAQHRFDCQQHPGVPARWRCRPCEAPLCVDCVEAAGRWPWSRATCRYCGALVEPLAPRQPPREDHRAFRERLPGMLLYPLRGGNIIGTVVLTITALLAGWAAVVVVPIYGFVFVVFAGVWFTVFGMDVTAESAAGEKVMPVLAIPESWLEGFFRPLLVAISPWLPAWAAVFFVQEYDLHPVLAGLIILATCLYAPMAMIACSAWQSVEAVNPRLVVPAIWRTLRDYLLLVGIWITGIVFMAGGAWAFYIVVLEWWYLSVLITLVGVYSFIVMFHMLGQFYHANRFALGWFETADDEPSPAHIRPASGHRSRRNPPDPPGNRHHATDSR